VDSLYEVLMSLALSGSKTETTTMIIYPVIQLECSKLTPHIAAATCQQSKLTSNSTRDHNESQMYIIIMR